MDNQSMEVVKSDTGPQLPARRAPDVADMLQAIVEKGVTAESVGALEKLADLYERMEAKRSERAFIEAFNALQADLPVIVASSIIPNRGKYEKFEDVMRVVGPLLKKHGFAVNFSQNPTENRIAVTCHLMHIGGHSTQTTFAVRLGGRADSETQADCKASTTAKRNSLTQALNIVIRQDVLTDEYDATMEGDPNAYVTPAQADELEHRAKMINAKIPEFLLFAGAPSFAKIPANRYAELDQLLARKEKRK